MKEGGYIVEKFLRELDYDDLVSKLEKFVKKHLKSFGIEIDDLTQYHNVVDDEIHYKMVNRVYDNNYFDVINFDITLIEKRISEILNRKLVIKDDY